MQHQVLADQPRGVGEPVGKPRRRRIQQQARRADAVAGQDHDLGRLELLAPVGVVVDRAGGHAVLVGGDLAHPAARAQLDAGADSERPVGDVGAGLGPLRAARRAVPEVDAGARGRHRRWWRWWCRRATSASPACSSPAHSAYRSCPAGSVASADCAAARPGLRPDRTRPSSGRSPRRSARAPSSQPASHPPRRPATSP